MIINLEMTDQITIRQVKIEDIEVEDKCIRKKGMGR